PKLVDAAATARKRLESFEKGVAALERAFDDRSASIRAAQRLLREAEDYAALGRDRESTVVKSAQTESRLAEPRETLSSHRGSVAKTINHLSVLFDSV